jgi:ankyrin repeat protein
MPGAQPLAAPDPARVVHAALRDRLDIPPAPLPLSVGTAGSLGISRQPPPPQSAPGNTKSRGNLVPSSASYFQSAVCCSNSARHFMEDAGPLACAAGRGDTEGLRAQLADGSSSSREHTVALRIAVANGHIAIVDALLSHGAADPSSKDSHVLWSAVREGRVDILQLLLADGRADPAADHSAALFEATRCNSAVAVQLLLADGRADPAADSSVALILAARRGHVVVIQLLLADGRADPAGCRSAALRAAARGGHAAVLQLLLADGRADPAMNDSFALEHAAREGHAAVAQLLLADRRADPTACHALVLAAHAGHADVVQLLLSVGRADPDTCGARLCSGLTSACLRGHVDVQFGAAHKTCTRDVMCLLQRAARWRRRRSWLAASAATAGMRDPAPRRAACLEMKPGPT